MIGAKFWLLVSPIIDKIDGIEALLVVKYTREVYLSINVMITCLAGFRKDGRKLKQLCKFNLEKLGQVYCQITITLTEIQFPLSSVSSTSSDEL